MVFDNKKSTEFYSPPKAPGIVNAPAMKLSGSTGPWRA